MHPPMPELSPRLTAPVEPRSRRRHRWALLITGMSLTLVALAAIGVIGAVAGYLVLDPVTRHRTALGLAALALGLAATWVWQPGQTAGAVLRPLGITGLTTVLLAGIAWTAVTTGASDRRTVA